MNKYIIGIILVMLCGCGFGFYLVEIFDNPRSELNNENLTFDFNARSGVFLVEKRDSNNRVEIFDNPVLVVWAENAEIEEYFYIDPESGDGDIIYHSECGNVYVFAQRKIFEMFRENILKIKEEAKEGK